MTDLNTLAQSGYITALKTNTITDTAGTGAPTFSNGIKTNAILDAAGGNTATINGIVPDLTPSGAVATFAMNTAPTGWLKANGAAVSRTTYAALFTAIGTTFGIGDGSTTFNVPDLRGEFIRGWDDARGIDTGRVFGSAQSSQNLAHTHDYTLPQMNQNGTNGTANDLGGSVFGLTRTSASSGGTEARPRNIALLACIKF